VSPDRITQETRERILDAAWNLLIEGGRADVSLAEIGKAAGVSRQSVYLAFGSRAGLLIAMVRRADTISEASQRMRAATTESDEGLPALREFTKAWFERIPQVLPVAMLLAQATPTDSDARAAWSDRMESLRGGFATILWRVKRDGLLKTKLSVGQAADIAWSLTHIDAWRHLVVERNWSPEQFASTRMAMLEWALIDSKAARKHT
jgi:AcrR family transcriptional regulator